MRDALSHYCASCQIDLNETLSWAAEEYPAPQMESARQAIAGFADWMNRHLPGCVPEQGDVLEWRGELLAGGAGDDRAEDMARVVSAWVAWVSGESGGAGADGVTEPDPARPGDGGCGEEATLSLAQAIALLEAPDNPDARVAEGRPEQAPPARGGQAADGAGGSAGTDAPGRGAEERVRMDEAVAFLCSGRTDVDLAIEDWIEYTSAGENRGALSSLSAFVEWMDTHGSGRPSLADIDAWVYSISEYVSPGTARMHGDTVRAFAAWHAGVPSDKRAAGDQGQSPLSPAARRCFGVDDTALDSWQRETGTSDTGRAALVASLDSLARWAASVHAEDRPLDFRDVDRWRVSMVGAAPTLAVDARARRVLGFLDWLHGGSAAGGEKLVRTLSSNARDLTVFSKIFGVSSDCLSQWLLELRLARADRFGAEPVLAFSAWLQGRREKTGKSGTMEGSGMDFHAPLLSDVEAWVDTLPPADAGSRRETVLFFLHWLHSRGLLGHDAVADGGQAPEPSAARSGGAGDAGTGAAGPAARYDDSLVADVAAKEALARKERSYDKLCRVFGVGRAVLDEFREGSANMAVLRQHVLAFVDWFEVFHPGARPLPEHIDRWYGALRQRLSLPTARDYRGSVCLFIRWLHDRGLYEYELPVEREERARVSSGGSAIVMEVFGIGEENIEEWRLDTWKQSGRAPGMTAILSFARWLRENVPSRPPRELPTGTQLQAWVDWLKGTPGRTEEYAQDGKKRIAASTISTYRYAVRSFLRWFQNRGVFTAGTGEAREAAASDTAALSGASSRAGRSRTALDTLAGVFRVSTESIEQWKRSRSGTGKKPSLSPMNKFAAWWLASGRQGVPTVDDIPLWGSDIMEKEHISRQTVTVYSSQVRSFIRWLEPEERIAPAGVAPVSGAGQTRGDDNGFPGGPPDDGEDKGPSAGGEKG